MARFAELTKAAEDATAEAKRIEAELVRLRWQNAQLNTSLARARAASERTEQRGARGAGGIGRQGRDAERFGRALGGRDRAAAPGARRRRAAARARHRIARRVRGPPGGPAGEGAERGSPEPRLRRAAGGVARARSMRSRTSAIGLCSASRRWSAKPSAGRSSWRRRAMRSRGSRRAGASSSSEVDRLRAAASSAADVARQNLLAVEARIKELNAALAGGEPAAGQTAAGLGTGAVPALVEAPIPAAGARSSTGPATSAATVAQPAEPYPRPSAARPPGPVPLTTRRPPPRSWQRGETAAESDLELIKSANATEGPADEALRRLSARPAARDAVAGAGPAGRSRRQARPPRAQDDGAGGGAVRCQQRDDRAHRVRHARQGRRADRRLSRPGGDDRRSHRLRSGRRPTTRPSRSGGPS